MNLRLGFALFLAIGAVVAVVAVGCSDLGEPLRFAPQAGVSASTLDFGTVAVGGSATRSVTVTNAGTANFVGAASVSCAGFSLEAGAGPFTVPPGGEHPVVVRFTPGAVGSFACDLSLGGGLAPVPLRGQASNQLPGSQCVVTPTTLDFGALPVGGNRILVFKVKNPGTASTALDVVSDRSTFGVLAGGGPSTLAPGDSLVVTVVFTPAAGGPDSCLIATGADCPQLRGRGAASTVSFAANIAPIFSSRGCTSCHGWTAANQIVNVTSAGYAPARIIRPFDLAGSVLYGKVTDSGQYGRSMPQGSSLIPLAERNRIRDWILEGAQNN